NMTVTSYSATGTRWNVNEPLTSERVEYGLIPGATIRTVAPGTGAPAGSFTVPVSDPNEVCSAGATIRAAGETIRARTESAAASARERISSLLQVRTEPLGFLAGRILAG